ncbi:MAG: hypothetical protein S0880_09800 [Actinomycetota bacterium]|nr:hypothetical protein [Actinomycetota bacterium]
MTATTDPTTLPTNDTTATERHTEPMATLTGGLSVLVLLNLVQVLAAFSGTEPHPPTEVVPLTAAIAALGVAAFPLVRAAQRAGLGLAVGCAGLSTIGMGPHKLLLEDGATIAPVALVGFGAAVAVIVTAVRELRAGR